MKNVLKISLIKYDTFNYNNKSNFFIILTLLLLLHVNIFLLL